MTSALSSHRILITGGQGFLGKHVWQQLEALAPAAIFTPTRDDYDLRAPKQVRTLLEECSPTLIIHLAAIVGGIGANQREPGRFFYDNAVMGLHLMEEARRADVQKFVSIATICAYPKHTPVPFRESDLWNGYPEETNAPYGLAKKWLLVQGQAYRQQYGFNAITLFPTNLYGPGDHFAPDRSHVIPALIRKLVDARNQQLPQVTVWGSGSASREFLHVRDAARAIVLAAAHYDSPEPVNIGGGSEITIADLAQLLRELCRYEGELVFDASQPDGQPRRCVDSSRARTAFGFTAEIEFRTGLAETIAWYEANATAAS